MSAARGAIGGGGIGVCGYRQQAGAPAVAAADDAGLESLFLEDAAQPQRERRLAGAAGGNIADDNDRHRHALRAQDACPVRETAQGRREAEQRRQGQQGDGKPGQAIPMAIAKGHAGSLGDAV